MKRNLKISDGQISLFGEDELMSFQGASHASRSRRQGKEKEPMTTDTSGRLCLQQFSRSVPDGSWGKMFSELLIGTPGWYSSRCALTWKLKATKSNRSYFQLVASTLPTDDTELSLLHTPRVTEIPEDPVKFSKRTGDRSERCFPNLTSQVLYGTLLKTPTAMDGMITSGKKNPVSGSSGTLGQEILSGFVYRRGILPTPTSFDRKTCRQDVPGRTVTRPSGQTFMAGLRMLAYNGLLPTPATCNYKGANTLESLQKRNRNHQTNNLPDHFAQSGKSSQLNPLFVEEMMGFPTGWILLPFLKESILQSAQSHSIDGDPNP